MQRLGSCRLTAVASGVFSRLTILTYLEENCLDGRPIGDYFDLIAGTSTGGIIALGLGAGLTARSAAWTLYINEGLPRVPAGGSVAGEPWRTSCRNCYLRNRYGQGRPG